MAVVEPKSMAVSLATPKSRMFTVDIAMSGFTDAETTAGGRLSPCHADDFATKPTTLAQSLLVSRGLLRRISLIADKAKFFHSFNHMLCIHY